MFYIDRTPRGRDHPRRASEYLGLDVTRRASDQSKLFE
jgi:hypothetical protein